jgi:predicted GTPase
VPIIVAINKIDKPGANPQRVIQELSEYGVMSQAWGGESEFVEISAKFNTNIDDLLETVLLVAEIQELKADQRLKQLVQLLRRVLIKGKVLLQLCLSNKVLCISKTLSWLVILSDVSVLWLMTWVVVKNCRSFKSS